MSLKMQQIYLRSKVQIDLRIRRINKNRSIHVFEMDGIGVKAKVQLFIYIR